MSKADHQESYFRKLEEYRHNKYLQEESIDPIEDQGIDDSYNPEPDLGY